MTEMLRNSYRNLCLGVLVGFAALQAEAGDNAALLKKLVEKGVITEGEAAVLAEEANNEYNDAAALPGWVQSLSLKGDLRLRYEQKHQDTSDEMGRTRGRYRFRWGGTATMNNGFKAGFRFASGSGNNPLSTNQTIGGTSKSDASTSGTGRDYLGIDQAYVQYDTGGTTIYAGKRPAHDKTGWMINKGFLDSDYTPEGVEIHTPLGDTGWTAHLGWDALAENSSTQDMDGLLMGQITGSVGGLKLGIGGLWIYNREVLSATAVGESKGIAHKDASGNSETSASKTASNFNPYFIDAKYSFETSGQPLSIGATYINNPGAYDDSNDSGYSLGAKLGKAKAAGSWEVGLEWRSMERDVMWAQLTDSDFGAFGARDEANDTDYDNGTNVEGIVLKAKYQIQDNVQLGLAWFETEAIEDNGSGNDSTTRIQADLVFKF